VRSHSRTRKVAEAVDYFHQKLAVHMQGMREALNRLQSCADSTFIEQRVDALVSEFSLLTREEIVRVYTHGWNLGRGKYESKP
jgi:hypothetical protein